MRLANRQGEHVYCIGSTVAQVKRYDTGIVCLRTIMDAKELLNEIRMAVSEQKQRGTQTIDADALLRYVDALEKDASESAQFLLEEFRSNQESARAHWRAKFDADMAQYRVNFEANQDAARATIQAGHSALRAAILINGGAAVALLAFVGSVWATAGGVAANLANFPNALLSFVLGVLAGTIATGINYLAAYAASSDSSRMFHMLNSLTMLLVLVSYVAFLTGGIVAFCSFIIG